MPGMLMSDRITINYGSISPASRFERLLARNRKVQHINALAHLAAKMLAKEIGDIRLVIDDQDAHMPPTEH
jgi:hypothetical protein